MSETPISDDELDFLDLETLGMNENDDGSLDIEFGPEYPEVDTSNLDWYDNIADVMDSDALDEIASDVIESFQADKDSRSDWEQMTADAVDNLGLVYDESSELFEGACTANHPLILESAVKFQSKVSNELLPSKGPCKTQIYGEKTEEKQKQAKRIRDDMNYELQHVMPEYYPETEKTLFMVALIGNGFKKTWYDPVKGRNCNELIVDRLYVNNNASSLQSAERITHQYYINKRRMFDLIDSNYFLDYSGEDLGAPGHPEPDAFSDTIREIHGLASETDSYDEVYTIIEQHCYLQLDPKTGLIDETKPYKPYVVICDLGSQKILSIRRNWSENDIKAKRLEWFVHYQFVPTFGFYALGLAHLLGNLQKTLTITIRSLADAGQFANLPAGFKNKNARIVGDDGPLSPGTFKDVEIPGIKPIREMFEPLPFKEPSQVLFLLLQELTAVGQKFADSTEQVIADSTNYGPVGTTMALLEASTRFYAAVYKRQYLSQTEELKILSRLISDYGDDEYPYIVDSSQEFSRVEDYDSNVIDIIPVSDPNYSSQAQRISKAQAMLDTAMKDGGGQNHNMREVYREVYLALEVEDIDRFLPPADKPQKLEPVEDILAMLSGKPIAAFKGQDHEAHIAVKSAWIQDPANGGSEANAQFHPIILANIREHTFQLYLEQMSALQAQEGLSQAAAAQRISRLNQIAQEEEQEGSPAHLLAKAEMIKAETSYQKEQREAGQDQFKLGVDLLQTAANIEREKNRAAEMNRKIDTDVIKIAADMLKTGMTEAKQGAKQSNDE
jgi:hypothetical protein